MQNGDPNLISVPKLLRMMASSELGTEGRRIIFNKAADIIEDHAKIEKLLEDVPGANALLRVHQLKKWHQSLYAQLTEIREAVNKDHSK